jgi:hypothetical protein
MEAAELTLGAPHLNKAHRQPASQRLFHFRAASAAVEAEVTAGHRRQRRVLRGPVAAAAAAAAARRCARGHPASGGSFVPQTLGSFVLQTLDFGLFALPPSEVVPKP